MFRKSRSSVFLSKASSLLVSLLVCLAPAAQAEIFSLGDSLSDAGALGFTYTNPISGHPYVMGKVWLQYLSSRSIPAFCNDRSRCTQNAGTFNYSSLGNNYAVGGAGVTFDSPDTAPNSHTDLRSQVHALLLGHKLSSKDAVTVWMGANDILAAVDKGDASRARLAVLEAARIFKREVDNLALRGNGASIYVITIPDLGKTPLGRKDPATSTLLSELTDAFNRVISEVTSMNVISIDSKPIFNRLMQTMDTSRTYCPNIIDPANICGSGSNPLNVYPEDNPNLLFADPIHPSATAHRVIAGQPQIRAISAFDR